MRSLGKLTLALLAAAPLAARALDAPHDLSNPTEAINCQKCHMGHNAPGVSLTSVAGNANLCQSCHHPAAVSPTGEPFLMVDSDQAVPGTGGTSHRWDALASNRGATPPNPGSSDPAEAAMGQHLESGRITCSTCHDPHNNTGRVGGRQHTSFAVDVATSPSSGGAGRTLTLLPPAADAAPKGYRVQIVTAGDPETSQFKVSNDNGVSWRGCTSPAAYDYVQTTAPPSTADGCQTGAAVPLNDGTRVTVTFVGTAVVGDFWRFYVGYPFLQVSNVDSSMCLVCHADRNQNHVQASGDDPGYPADGTNVFHHPVGDSLNANGGGYDRGSATTNEVLDANGALQATSNDGIRSNDLRLGASNSVHCLSCHRVHNADSNSLSEYPQ